MKSKMLLAIALTLAAGVCLARDMHLKEMTYSYGSDAALAPLDETFRQALTDSGWTALETAPGHIVAKTVVNLKHHARVDIVYGNGQARIKLLDSQNLNVEPCIYEENRRHIRGTCVSGHYYKWLENLIAALPVAHARLAAPDDAARIAGNSFVFEALLIGSSDDVIVAARALGTNPPLAVTDLAAQVLSDNCDRTDLEENALSWLARVLGNTGTERYRPVINHCLPVATYRVRKYLQLAADAMTDPALPFKSGSIDVAAVRARVAQALAKKLPPALPALLAVPYGAQVHELLAVAHPDRLIAMELGEDFGTGPNRVRGGRPMVVLEYTNAASFVFTTRNDSDAQWVVLVTDYPPGLEALKTEDRALAVKQMLGGSNGVVLRYNAERLSKATLRDIPSLDAVAQRLAELRSQTGRVYVEALSLLCEILGRSRQGRYRTFLLDLSSTAAESDVRQIAMAGVARLPSRGPGFVPAAPR